LGTFSGRKVNRICVVLGYVSIPAERPVPARSVAKDSVQLHIV